MIRSKEGALNIIDTTIEDLESCINVLEDSDTTDYVEVNSPNKGSRDNVVDDLLLEERATILNKRSVCSVILGNLDLGHIFNGY